VGRTRHGPGGVDVSLSAGAAAALAPGVHRRARDRAAVSPRALGDRPVSRPRDAADRLWRGGVIRRLVAVALLLGADFPVRRRVHRLPGAVAQARAPAAKRRGDYCFLMVNLPKAMPRSQPSPVPDSASEISPLVTTCACDDFTAPACASALA